MAYGGKVAAFKILLSIDPFANSDISKDIYAVASSVSIYTVYDCSFASSSSVYFDSSTSYSF